MNEQLCASLRTERQPTIMRGLVSEVVRMSWRSLLAGQSRERRLSAAEDVPVVYCTLPLYAYAGPCVLTLLRTVLANGSVIRAAQNRRLHRTGQMTTRPLLAFPPSVTRTTIWRAVTVWHGAWVLFPLLTFRSDN